ncbi:CDP-alcohol phosphatidyltransferase family protein [uncultured Senegalimassilia sp.]|uniref:CDP-alcohol phosphatidyltransferase family protein n=1 Tax=uncultured Senegalimassilia sp. TaxID=1714350 RepID=UPI0025F4325F|nr:CDP-alcohol phosphatidyltransferase family protein [uncultured Senegalimassilia sp.]
MSSQKTEAVTNRIFTIPNVISFIRLCMVPVYMVLLLNGYDLLAAFMFALAAGTDWIDGQLARRTNCVSKLGQLLDPAVDRILMSCGVIGLMLVGRLPIWIVVVVLGRDLMLLVGGAYLLKRYHERVAVIYPGKVATTFLFVGFAGLLLNMPLIGGLGWFEASWLPGFGSEACSWGIWFVYAGLLIGLFTTLYYVLAGYRKMQKARRLEAKGRVR